MEAGEGSNPEDGSESDAEPKVTQLLEAADAAMAKRNVNTALLAAGQASQATASLHPNHWQRYEASNFIVAAMLSRSSPGAPLPDNVGKALALKSCKRAGKSRARGKYTASDGGSHRILIEHAEEALRCAHGHHGR